MFHLEGRQLLWHVVESQSNFVCLRFVQLVKNDFEEVPLSAASMTSSPTHLSPYLRFGCLSARMMWQRLTDTYAKVCLLDIKSSRITQLIFLVEV